ncbi:hypothetical protein [Helicobacter cetorum]|uniref:Uncharacterized protein n=1 Tax=Helicobacter cetorum (strain ATCC BAA-540 / CCUG 52418 / MIT 99-5656) TaxID=1163745 RepID=I0ERW1_HELCM|nr:hypothetical protein [Helicobacter cetorum]AFI05680.1 hypothetical protein HCD_03320 [Helicobacter cetorum MIT 99-5656]
MVNICIFYRIFLLAFSGLLISEKRDVLKSFQTWVQTKRIVTAFPKSSLGFSWRYIFLFCLILFAGFVVSFFCGKESSQTSVAVLLLIVSFAYISIRIYQLVTFFIMLYQTRKRIKKIKIQKFICILLKPTVLIEVLPFLLNILIVILIACATWNTFSYDSQTSFDSFIIKDLKEAVLNLSLLTFILFLFIFFYKTRTNQNIQLATITIGFWLSLVYGIYFSFKIYQQPSFKQDPKTIFSLTTEKSQQICCKVPQSI